ncbi:hypothetical protein SAMN02745702_01567 [Desulfobaculum bizertense DSM 18034]|uniref:Uncharacterized protein n=1 Tax=Desulfobaculum bizertense DSM 18034 TaxID=1121442 RepID=A0A1T4W3Q5_9BACT|nr:hypothetical protein SAMN02745702_01567 [Desulfobaculum bizertense DSM 18034]
MTRDSVSCSPRGAERAGVILLGRCPKPCKGRCPLTPPKDEALGNPAFAQKRRLNGMKALLSSPSAFFFELVGVPRLRVLLPFSDRTYFFSERERSEKKWSNSQKRKTFLSHSHPSLNSIHAKREWNSNSLRIRKGIIPLRGGLGAGPHSLLLARSSLAHFLLPTKKAPFRGLVCANGYARFGSEGAAYAKALLWKSGTTCFLRDMQPCSQKERSPASMPKDFLKTSLSSET